MSIARTNTAKAPVCACVLSEGIAGGSAIRAGGGDYRLINTRQNQLADAAEFTLASVKSNSARQKGETI